MLYSRLCSSRLIGINKTSRRSMVTECRTKPFHSFLLLCHIEYKILRPPVSKGIRSSLTPARLKKMMGRLLISSTMQTIPPILRTIIVWRTVREIATGIRFRVRLKVISSLGKDLSAPVFLQCVRL